MNVLFLNKLSLTISDFCLKELLFWLQNSDFPILISSTFICCNSFLKRGFLSPHLLRYFHWFLNAVSRCGFLFIHPDWYSLELLNLWISSVLENISLYNFIYYLCSVFLSSPSKPLINHIVKFHTLSFMFFISCIYFLSLCCIPNNFFWSIFQCSKFSCI